MHEEYVFMVPFDAALDWFPEVPEKAGKTSYLPPFAEAHWSEHNRVETHVLGRHHTVTAGRITVLSVFLPCAIQLLS